MKEKVRKVSVTLDTLTYARLEGIRERDGFRALPELIRALLRVFADSRQCREERVFDLPPDEQDDLAAMFGELSDSGRKPDGTVPVRHPRKDTYK